MNGAAPCTVGGFMRTKSLETARELAEIRATLAAFVRGLLPDGALPSWKRGIWA